ncbi:hypothetical protein HPB51_024137 [Rhipicephalus microplus]|uniref:Uncharacterized protein n=1 Tax=Rhipicephalus microplus TaxID=6941 RepID=A0A9J6DJV1_RHIMP|nr:hypothetical protein HPB51_024137 [Rhipicephalus microplus]
MSSCTEHHHTIIQQDDDIYDDESMAQTATVLHPNERVGQLVARLAARYQDGGIFWIDAVPLRGGQFKRRLLLDINKQFLRFAEQSDSIPWRHRRRTMMDGASSTTEEPIEGLVEEVSRGIREVLAIWKEAGNLLVHNPFSVSLRSLDEYGLDSNVLVHGLNAESSDVGDRYSGDDEIEVINQVLLPFLRKVLLHANINMAPYLAWEFAGTSANALLHIEHEIRTACRRTAASSASSEWPVWRRMLLSFAPAPTSSHEQR